MFFAITIWGEMIPISKIADLSVIPAGKLASIHLTFEAAIIARNVILSNLP